MSADKHDVDADRNGHLGPVSVCCYCRAANVPRKGEAAPITKRQTNGARQASEQSCRDAKISVQRDDGCGQRSKNRQHGPVVILLLQSLCDLTEIDAADDRIGIGPDPFTTRLFEKCCKDG